MSTAGQFAWGGKATVFETVRGIAVHENEHGQIVIRQEGWPEDDTVIVIPKSWADDLVAAIKEAKRGER